MSKHRQIKESRLAHLRMQKAAQVSIDARLTRLELVFKNKARLK